MAPKKKGAEHTRQKETAPRSPGDDYDFDVVDESHELITLAKKLAGVKGKDGLVKLLKNLRQVLEGLPQEADALGAARDVLPNSLLQVALSDKADKDVRLYGALCIVNFMRVCAPDVPYTDGQLKDIFGLLLECWSRLADTGSATFELCRAMLQTTADVRFFLLMLDLEGEGGAEELLPRTFSTLLGAARPDNLEVVEGPVLSVLLGLLEEMEAVPGSVMDTVLRALVMAPAPGGSGKGPVDPQAAASAQRLAARLLLPAREDRLRSAIQRHVISVLRGQGQAQGQQAAAGAARSKKATGGGGGGPPDAINDAFTLLHGLQASAPLLLLPVVPELKALLRHDDEPQRATAVALLCRLLAAPPQDAAVGAAQQPHPMSPGLMGAAAAAAGPHPGAATSLATQYPDLFDDLLLRYADQTVALRQQMLSHTMQLAAVAAAVNPGGELEHQVVKAAVDRLHDFDDRVRAAACRALCGLAALAVAAPSGGAGGAGVLVPAAGAKARSRSTAAAAAVLTVGPQLYDRSLVAALREVGDRLRDRKVAVRREAAAGLLAAWRAACIAVQQGALSLRGLVRSVGWVPARLCMEAVRDGELRPHLMGLLAQPHQQQQGQHGHAQQQGTGTMGLVPWAFGEQLGAAIWTALWESYTPVEHSAVRKVLSVKAQAASDLQQLAALRRRLRAATAAAARARAAGQGAAGTTPGNAQAEVNKLQVRLQQLCQDLSRVAGATSGEAAAKGAEQLAGLVAEARDNFLWEGLERLAAPAAMEPEAAAAARKDVLSRLPGGGSKAPTADLVSRLLVTVQPTLLAPRHVCGLVTALSAGGAAVATDDGGSGGVRDGDAAAAADLLVAVAKAAPALMSAAAKQLVGIVTLQPPAPELPCTTAVRVVRHAARYCLQQPSAAGGKANGGDDDGDKENQGDKGKGAAAGSGSGKVKGKEAANGVVDAEESRAQLAEALSRLCLGPYPKAAKAAVHALVQVLGPREGREEVGQLAGRLVGCLRPGQEALRTTASALQALASVGEVAPEVFADHASTFCSFVTGRYLRADLTPPKRPPPPKPKPAARRGKATAAAAADPEDDPHPDTVMEEPGATDWDHPSRVIRLKRAALRALCRALTPDADAAYASASPIPPATAEAVQSPAVQDVLVQLLAIEYDEQDSDEYGAKTYLDRAHLRAAAAAGLLRLARRHDSRLSPGCYVALALAMQDPAMEVRRDTGEQVRQFLHGSLVAARPAHVMSRYAALLPLAAMDPREDHRESAARALRELVMLQRARAQQQAMAAAAAVAAGPGGSGGAPAAPRPSLADQPEFMLAFLVYVLAHHPDFPQPGPPESDEGEGEDDDAVAEDVEPEPSEYRPFQDMLQFALEPLLAAGGGPGGAAGSAAAAAAASEVLPAVCKLLRTVKLMRDADPASEADAPTITRNMRILCDIGLATAKAVTGRELAAAAAAGAKGGAKGREAAAAGAEGEVAALARRDHPAQVVLPKKLYTLADRAETKTLARDGSCLPGGAAYEVVLSPAVAELARKLPAAAAGAAGGGGAAAKAKGGQRRRSGGGFSEGHSLGSRSTGSGGEPGEEDEKEVVADVKQGKKAAGAGEKKAALGKRKGAAGEEPGEVAKAGGKGAGAAKGQGTGRGKGAGKQAQAAAAAKRRRSSGGYESMSEGEESSASEEEEEEEEEEDQQEASPPPAKKQQVQVQKQRQQVNGVGQVGGAQARAGAAGRAAAGAKAVPAASKPAPAARKPQQRDEYDMPASDEEEQEEEEEEEAGEEDASEGEQHHQRQQQQHEEVEEDEEEEDGGDDAMEDGAPAVAPPAKSRRANGAAAVPAVRAGRGGRAAPAAAAKGVGATVPKGRGAREEAEASDGMEEEEGQQRYGPDSDVSPSRDEFAFDDEMEDAEARLPPPKGRAGKGAGTAAVKAGGKGGALGRAGVTARGRQGAGGVAAGGVTAGRRRP